MDPNEYQPKVINHAASGTPVDITNSTMHRIYCFLRCFNYEFEILSYPGLERDAKMISIKGIDFKFQQRYQPAPYLKQYSDLIDWNGKKVNIIQLEDEYYVICLHLDYTRSGKKIYFLADQIEELLGFLYDLGSLHGLWYPCNCKLNCIEMAMKGLNY